MKQLKTNLLASMTLVLLMVMSGSVFGQAQQRLDKKSAQKLSETSIGKERLKIIKKQEEKKEAKKVERRILRKVGTMQDMAILKKRKQEKKVAPVIEDRNEVVFNPNVRFEIPKPIVKSRVGTRKVRKNETTTTKEVGISEESYLKRKVANLSDAKFLSLYEKVGEDTRAKMRRTATYKNRLEALGIK